MPNIYSISQINSYIKNMFAQDYMLGLVYVRGEVSNLKYHSSGHIYFTLKDEHSAIACVMFAGNRNNLRFRMTEGQQVVVKGSIEVYERDGKYQVYAKEIKPDGQGSLSEAFEALKARLEEMGMFDPMYKQRIPSYIHTLGVVTAPTGAAVQDIINVSLRRNPYLQIILYPAIVQGDAAPDSIISGIHALENYGVDTIIVGRGGGSMEDLWGFNDEGVAQAIFDCKVPIISAVGHETDFTIADFVSDLRAPTPSAAAELAVSDLAEIENRIRTMENRLQNGWDFKFSQYKNALEQMLLRLRLYSPESSFTQQRTRAMQLEEQLQSLMEQRCKDSRHQLELFAMRLRGCSPLDKLEQGYSYVTTQEGHTLTDVKQVKAGDLIQVQLHKGKLQARVEKLN